MAMPKKPRRNCALKSCGKVLNRPEKYYCDNVCQHQHRWETVIKPKIEKGLASKTNNNVLYRYLVETRGNKCGCCKLKGVWREKPLRLQVDHKDGDSDNGSLKNVWLLCPNCHSQTEFFKKKGKGSRYKRMIKKAVRATSRRKRYDKTYKARH